MIKSAFSIANQTRSARLLRKVLVIVTNRRFIIMISITISARMCIYIYFFIDISASVLVARLCTHDVNDATCTSFFKFEVKDLLARRWWWWWWESSARATVQNARGAQSFNNIIDSQKCNEMLFSMILKAGKPISDVLWLHIAHFQEVKLQSSEAVFHGEVRLVVNVIAIRACSRYNSWMHFCYYCFVVRSFWVDWCNNRLRLRPARRIESMMMNVLSEVMKLTYQCFFARVNDSTNN